MDTVFDCSIKDKHSPSKQQAERDIKLKASNYLLRKMMIMWCIFLTSMITGREIAPLSGSELLLGILLTWWDIAAR